MKLADSVVEIDVKYILLNIWSTGVLGFQTFKLAFCVYNKLHSHAEILS